MTPGQKRWLEKLQSSGRQSRPRYGALPCSVCYRNGWTKAVCIDTQTGEEITKEQLIARKFDGCHFEEIITAEGVAVLKENVNNKG
jgi:hypothetical protein